jgi:hypothetical protein
MPACGDSRRDATRDADASGGEAGAAHEATCASFVRMLTDCGLLTGTRLAGCDDDNPLLACAADCVRTASCDAVQAMYCGGSYNDFALCLDECRATLPLPEFPCGDGTRVPARWTCDGATDCENGADEDCPEGMFACESGLEIPLGWQCDGVSDCSSGEDELDCGPPFSCASGAAVARSRECDGTPDCTDADDELDCATLTCP